MVTKRAAATKLDPKVFDFNSLVAKSRAPKPVTVSVFLRADLVAPIREVKEQIAKFEASKDAERAIGDEAVDVEALWAENDELVTDFNASEVQFEFRARKFSDITNARAAMVRDNIDLADDNSGELSVSYALAETCMNATMSGGEWHQWREQIGETAFSPLVQAMIEADSGIGVSAPFSQRPSPGPTSEA